MNTIKHNEKAVDNYISNILFNMPFNEAFNNYLNEDSGHPLFKYGNSDETFDWIARIKDAMNIINDKIKTAKIKNTYRITVNETGESFIYDEYLPISISINKLGFKDVINSQKSNLKIVIRDIIEGATEFSEYLTIRNISSGEYVNDITRKLLNGKFVNTNKDADIMHAICYAINGKVIPISFLQVFLHEYLHFYEHYNRFINNTHVNNERVVIRINHARKNINRHIFTKEEAINLDFIIYHLYCGEDNAKIGELFSDLINFNIQDLYDLNKHKKDMRVFKTYEKLKNAISVIKQCDISELSKFIRNNSLLIQPRKYLNNTEINKVTINKTDEQIVKLFINSIEDKLNKFYEKIMKFSGRFIYMQQEHENQIVTSVKQD